MATTNYYWSSSTIVKFLEASPLRPRDNEHPKELILGGSKKVRFFAVSGPKFIKLSVYVSGVIAVCNVCIPIEDYLVAFRRCSRSRLEVLGSRIVHYANRLANRLITFSETND